MPSHGHIQDGRVVPDGSFPWPEGTKVVVDAAAPETGDSIADRLRSVIGKAKDLPEGMAENHHPS